MGKVIGKFKDMKIWGIIPNMLYNACVATVLNSGIGVWGSYSNRQMSEKNQNRATRSFLGVHKYSANLAINGDMGWTNQRNRQKLDMITMITLWNNL